MTSPADFRRVEVWHALKYLAESEPKSKVTPLTLLELYQVNTRVTENRNWLLALM